MKNIQFQIISWEARDDIVAEESENEDNNETVNSTYLIELFGRTKDGKTVYLKVTDYRPYFFIELDKKWSVAQVGMLVNEIKKKVWKKYSDTLFKWEIVYRNKFKEFDGYTVYPFLKLVFTCYEGFKKYKYTLFKELKIRCLSADSIELEQYESNLDPFLRCMHLRELKSTGWAEAKECTSLRSNTSCCDINLTTKWINLYPIDDKTISGVVILSYDIECGSLSGGFPQAKKDPVIMIGSTVSRYGEKDCFYKNIITLGTCKPIEGAEVIACKTEEEVLLKWTELVRKINPDVLVSYNGFGFDNKYMYDRAKRLGIDHKFMMLSRLNGVKSEFKVQDLSSSALGENKLYYPSFEGRVQIDLLKLVQQIDKLDSYTLDFVASTYIRETITDIIEDGIVIKTPKTYGLEPGRFISVNYHDGLSDNKYGRDEKFLVVDVTENSITVDHKIDKEQLDFKNCSVYWCQAKDDIKPQDIFDCLEGTSKQRQRIAKYCIQDCSLLNTLMVKLNILNNYVGMANVCHVPLSYIFLRGQGIKIFSLVAERCRKKNHLIPYNRKSDNIEVNFDDIDGMENSVVVDQIHSYEIKDDDKTVIPSALVDLLRTDKRIEIHARKKGKEEFKKIHKDEFKILKKTKKTFTINNQIELDLDKYDYFWVFEDNSYEGATVFIPEIGIHRQPVAVLDYKSLYPSSMIMYNMSPECCLKADSTVDPELYNDYEVFQVEAKMGADKTKTITFLRKKDGSQIGILAEVLIDLLKARSDTRKMMALEKDPSMKSVLDGLQLAFKIVANSLYGQTGSKVSAIYKKEIAAATTATGRDMLIFAKNFTEEKMAKISKALLKKDHMKQYYKTMKEIFADYNLPRVKSYFFNLFGNSKVNEKTDYSNLKEHRKKLGIKSDSGTEMENEFKKLYNSDAYDTNFMLEAFYDEIYKEVREIHDNFQITCEPKVVYGDSVTGDMPVLLRDSNGKVYVDIAEKIGKRWHPYNQFKPYDKDLREKEQDDTVSIEVWSDKGWTKVKRVIRHKTDKKIFEVETGGDIVKVTEDHSLIAYDDVTDNITYMRPKEIKIGTTLLTSMPDGNFLNVNIELLTLSLREKIKHVVSKYGNVNDYFFFDSKDFFIRFVNREYIEIMEVFIMLKSLGIKDLYVHKIDRKNNITDISNRYKPCNNTIETITEIGRTEDYVYDLETDVGHFHAGLGRLIVKNTDSIFFSPYFKNIETGVIMTDKKSLEKAIKLGDLISKMTFLVLKDPEELEYEKTFWPLCLLKKKKYVGNKYEFDPNKYKQTSMGIVLKRRDNAPIVKIICGAIVRELLNNTAQGAIEYTRRLLNDLINHKFRIEKFIITKTLRDTYKDRTKIAHAVLADRIEERTGNKIASNTRMAFVYKVDPRVTTYITPRKYVTRKMKDGTKKTVECMPHVIVKKKKGTLQGELLEDPDYMLEHGLKIDTLFYITNQIMKPACQFLELAIERPEELFHHYIQREIARRDGKRSVLTYDIFEDSNNSGSEPASGPELLSSDSDD